ncbi:MAG: M48 family metalloprotease [Candidatus Omnitrophica bacterium]|nr:M48 family metalloprotease [Candidatus Omnitrophota bacterium]
MPYSFTQIEKDKSATIGFVFCFLVLFYVFVIAGFSVIGKHFWLIFFQHTITLDLNIFTAWEWFCVILIGAVVASIHYFVSISGLTPRVLRWMGAVDPDPADIKQKTFLNILDEVSAATGGVKFQGMIIPQTSLNAFAIDDDEVMPVIGVTEGALYRLNRAQLEAVVAHEAAHILKGDCARATMVSAMFEFYTLPMQEQKRTTDYLRIPNEDYENFIGRCLGFMGLGMWIFIIVVAAFYFFTSSVAFIMRMLISREAKLRADAIAVRLTRDPVSLAQAIRLLAENWRGAGSRWEALDTVFFLSPLYSSLNEQENFMSDIFSTHPSVSKRLNILLDMAQYSREDLDQSVGQQLKDSEIEFPTDLENPYAGKRWMLERDNKWVGPFVLADMGMVHWLRPMTRVKRWGNDQIQLASEDEDLKLIALSMDTKGQKDLCPSCKVDLKVVVYEHEELKLCSSCEGVVVSEDQTGSILIRKEAAISEEVYSLARRIQGQEINQNINWDKLTQLQTQNKLDCPNCCKVMKTRPFNMIYPSVVIDKCLACGSMWFEKGELDLLQALYELKCLES